MNLASCIGCGCDDFHACPYGCWWLRVCYETGQGVCSECENHLEAWDRGDRTSHAVPASELERPQENLPRIPAPPSTSQGHCHGNHDWPFEDVRDSDCCRRCGMGFLRHIHTEMP